jgi:hypothetical protein
VRKPHQPSHLPLCTTFVCASHRSGRIQLLSGVQAGDRSPSQYTNQAPGCAILARSGSGRTEMVIVDAAKVLALLHTANEKVRLVPFSEFYNHELSAVRRRPRDALAAQPRRCTGCITLRYQ